MATLREALTKALAAVKGAAPGPWEVDTLHNEGSYGSGDEGRTGFKSRQMQDVNGLVIFDSLNADHNAVLIEEEDSDEFVYALDVAALCNFQAAEESVNFVRENGEKILALLQATFPSLTDAQCEAIYDAVSRANLTRDVKSPERKCTVIRNALEGR